MCFILPPKILFKPSLNLFYAVAFSNNELLLQQADFSVFHKVTSLDPDKIQTRGVPATTPAESVLTCCQLTILENRDLLPPHIEDTDPGLGCLRKIKHEGHLRIEWVGIGGVNRKFLGYETILHGDDILDSDGDAECVAGAEQTSG